MSSRSPSSQTAQIVRVFLIGPGCQSRSKRTTDRGPISASFFLPCHKQRPEERLVLQRDDRGQRPSIQDLANVSFDVGLPRGKGRPATRYFALGLGMLGLLALIGTIGAVEIRHGIGAAPDRLGVMPKGHCWVGVPGQLGHQPNFDPLSLQDGNERVSSSVWRHIGQAKSLKCGAPKTLPKVLIEKGPTAAGARPGPSLKASGSGEHPVELAFITRAHKAPSKKHFSQCRSHGNLAATSSRLGRFGQRAVALLDAVIGDDAVLKIHVLP